MATKEKNELLTYKGKPLVRCGKELYYGDPGEKFVIMLKVLSTKEVQGEEVADKIMVALLNTDPDARPHERIVNKTEKRGLYSALDIAQVWLERVLNN